MDGGSSGLSDLLDLAASLANNRTALGGRNQEIEVEVTVPVSGPVAVPLAPLSALQRLADQGVRLHGGLRSHSPISHWNAP